MPTKTEADAKATVQAHADQVAAQVGGKLTNPAVNAAPCEDDGQFSVQGAYQIPLPEAEHLAAATKVRDAWKAAGWSITDDRTFGSQFVLTAESSEGHYVDLESTAPPTMLALIIRSPCYRDPKDG